MGTTSTNAEIDEKESRKTGGEPIDKSCQFRATTRLKQAKLRTFQKQTYRDGKWEYETRYKGAEETQIRKEDGELGNFILVHVPVGFVDDLLLI